MIVLGVNAYHGDVAAVLVRDGKLVAAVEEERFRRVKHWAGFPREAIRTCLEMAGARPEDIAHFAVSRNPRANLLRKAFFTLRNRPSLGLVRDRLRNAGRVHDVASALFDSLGESRIARRLESEEARRPEREEAGRPNAWKPETALPRSVLASQHPSGQASQRPSRDAIASRIHWVEHHPSHLASAFFVSPFDEAAVCAIDGFGDFVSTSWGIGRGSRLDVIHRTYFPHSLGLVYLAITQFLGFPKYGDEYKVMGLAPYGKPEYVEALRRLIHLKPEGRFELDLSYFRHHTDGVSMTWDDGEPTIGPVFTAKLEELLGPARKPDDDLEPRHEAIAASLQAVYEETALHILNAVHEKTGLRRLCLAGGCAMNSVLNGKIRERTPFEEIYIQPAAADNGTALGAAFYVWHHTLGNPRSFVMDHAFWGPEFSDSQIQQALEPFRIPHSAIRIRQLPEEELCRWTAERISEGKIVGWFQGRMEWGARALGNRSILADPRRADMREIINTKIKFREKFRPFAPSILEESVDDYFVGAVPDPFMIQVYPVRPEKRAVIPAVTHVDGSGRLQTVNRQTNPLYWKLIKAFEKQTGVPVLLNTSFNENEPIVHRPEEAIDCFLRTGMDVLVLGNCVVEKSDKG